MPRVNNKDFFAEQIKHYGDDVKSVNWGSIESQHKRFEIIIEYLDDIEHATLVDAGCGLGDFYDFLTQHNMLPKEYIGLDITTEMIHHARQKFPQLKFLETNILEDALPKADYYIASGSLNMLTYPSTYKFIQKCFEQSNKKFIFNILSTHATFFDHGYNYMSPSELLANCMRLTSNVSLRHDYLSHDFTIVMNKEFQR